MRAAWRWGVGAMGNARWRGARLKDVLTKAGLKKDALEIVFDGAAKDQCQAEPGGPVTRRQPPVIDKDADEDQGRDQQEADGEALEEAEGGSPVPGHGEEEHMVQDLARPVGNPEPLLDDDLRDPIHDHDGGGDPRPQEIAADPVQRAATRTTLTWRSSPSMRSVSVEAPSGGPPRPTATARVSVAM